MFLKTESYPNWLKIEQVYSDLILDSKGKTVWLKQTVNMDGISFYFKLKSSPIASLLDGDYILEAFT